MSWCQLLSYCAKFRLGLSTFVGFSEVLASSGMVPCTLRDRCMSGHSPRTSPVTTLWWGTPEVSPSSWHAYKWNPSTPVLEYTKIQDNSAKIQFLATSSFSPGLKSGLFTESAKVHEVETPLPGYPGWRMWKLQTVKRKLNFRCLQFPVGLKTKPHQSGQQWF